MLTTEGDALLRDIIAHPDDDGLRLIYADWCEDNGQAERAEFVRAQIEFAGLVDGPGMCPKDQPALCRSMRCQSCVMRRRMCQVMLSAMIPNGPGRQTQARYLWGPAVMAQERLGSWTFCRGLVEEVEIRLGDWLTHGPALVRAHPLRRVVLTDRVPDTVQLPGMATRHGWYRALKRDGYEPASNLPWKLWGHLDLYRYFEGRLRWYGTSEAALDALSAAALAWARSNGSPNASSNIAQRGRAGEPA